MSKVRVYEVAKQLNLEPKAMVALFQTLGVSDVRNHMSSVDGDAVDRVKRHLEKQRTHDVVEERIRPTVLKRRAIAKPDAPAASTPALPADRMSEPAIATTAKVAPPKSSARLPEVVESKPALLSPEVPPSAPASKRRMGAAKPASVRDVAVAKDVSTKEVAPSDRASEHALQVPPAPRSVRAVEDAAPVSEQPRKATLLTPSAEVTESFAQQTQEAEPVFEEPAPPVSAPPVSAPPSVAPPSIAPSASPSVAPRAKTGVEYWTGRPGVPMPTPSNVVRSGIGGGATAGAPRRVQYDPRGNTGGPRPTGTRGGPQGGFRPGGGIGGGRPGQMGRPGMRGMPGMKRTINSTTQEMSAHKKVVRIDENITIQSMAQKMSLKSSELLMKLIGMGMTGIHINTSLDADTAKILASDFGWEVEDMAVSEEASLAAARGEDAEVEKERDENAVLRPPVVTVMGHVDHGKTSLLDKIRKANVASGEAGGITQHIGAYKVQTNKGTIVFLDTPGHEAFTAMRARGASVTDLVVLVVAADDGVMPQTREAVSHAKSANVPIIVAVNKVDKPSAEPDRVRRELVELGLQPEEWGGDTMFINVSAHTGEGIETLLDALALQAEVLELYANPKKPASGAVVEALLDRGRGPVARILVQDGTLKVGDFVLAGAGAGKVRAMTNEHGKNIHEAGPSTPVEILGLSDVPAAGDTIYAVKDIKKAQEILESRKTKAQGKRPIDVKVSLEDIAIRARESGQLELRVIVKGDVQGSVEAVSEALTKLTAEKVRLSVVHAGVGAITEGDVNLAIAAKSIIIGFNVKPAGKAAALADENKIEIRSYTIIYQAVDDVRSAMEGLLPAFLVEKVTGKAELRQLFRVKNTTIAGSYVLSGVIKRSGSARVLRAGVVMHSGKIGTLRRFKDDAKEVAEGFECGIALENYNELVEGDILECFEMEEVKQKL
jgi:translation initiation factor IF-2